MKDQMLNLYLKLQDLWESEAGQDLVEYSMVFAMVALGAVVGMKSLDAAIVQAFSTISFTINSALTSAS